VDTDSNRAALLVAWNWAAERDFIGYDPYDALRSPLLDQLHSKFGRTLGIIATQLMRRSPLNMRRVVGITPAANAKGLGLFLSTAALTRRIDEASALARRLRLMQSPGWDVPCWGYPFPWRSRAFYLPENTPTIVATTFVAEGFLDLFELLRDVRDLETALGACRFILEKLNRNVDSTGACLSYSPLDHSAVYNASILGARLLVRTGVASGRADLIEQAEPLARFVIARQNPDGSWPYGDASFHRWTDSFHTGFVLSALDVYARATGDAEAARAVSHGARFYVGRFFGPGGEPYYFADQPYPFDIHSASQGVITLVQLRDHNMDYQLLAERVGSFMRERFLEPDGHFRYQIRRTHYVSIPFMRWSQAWGVRGLAALAESVQR
jgi:hypothetical protein